MAKKEILMFVALVGLISGSEVEEVEQKKRGAGKPTSLNAIPTGAQKPEYTYNIYSQNTQSSSSPSYQASVPNNFYPNHGNQYYSQQEASQYPAQPQLNLIPPASSSQFVPLNFIPNTGYTQKLQLVPSKSANGNLQYVLQQPNYQSPLLYPQQQYFAPNQVQHNQLVNYPQQGHFNYQSLFGNQYLGHPSQMVLFAQPNPSLYNNLLYQNPAQNLYYPQNTQVKYNQNYVSSPPIEYDKTQGSSQSISPKEDNDITGQNSDYLASDSNTSYETSYSPSRSSAYSKLK